MDYGKHLEIGMALAAASESDLEVIHEVFTGLATFLQDYAGGRLRAAFMRSEPSDGQGRGGFAGDICGELILASEATGEDGICLAHWRHAARGFPVTIMAGSESVACYDVPSLERAFASLLELPETASKLVLAMGSEPALANEDKASGGDSRDAETSAVTTLPAGKIWPNCTPSQAQKFLDLVHEFNIPQDEDGRPVPCRPVNELVSEMSIIDPISGKDFKMLRRWLMTEYGLSIEELRAMFYLPSDFPATAPYYVATKPGRAAAGR